MVENLQSICVNTAYACAAGVGVVVVAYGAARGMKFLSGGVKCVTAVSLVGSLIIGGMTVTSVHIAAAKTNDTQQVNGDLSNTNDLRQVEGGTGVLKSVVQGRARIPAAPQRVANGEASVLGDIAQGRARIPAAPQRVANGEANDQALRRSRSLRPTMLSPITDDDIAVGWRVVSVSSNALEASTFTMPTNATVWESAQAYGRGWGSWKIPLGGWRFTYDAAGNGRSAPMLGRGECISKARFASARDWGRESGRGFYGRPDTASSIIFTLLMSGIPNGAYGLGIEKLTRLEV